MVQNRALIFKAPPEDWPVPGVHFGVETRSFDFEAPPPPRGLVVKNLSASLDPYLRGRMKAPGTDHYFAVFPLNEPMGTRSIAKVIKSDNAKFSEGDIVVGMSAIAEYAPIEAAVVDSAGFTKLENPYNLDHDVFLGALGMPGLTAYASLYEIGKPQKGQTIFISSASGAVGQLVGQLAKHEGLKVIGSVGSNAKLDFILKDLEFDGGFNYKAEKVEDALKRLAPEGLDIYYDNVGGEQLDVALSKMKKGGRIVACGMISQYNAKPEDIYNVKNLMLIIGKSLTMRGFLVGDPDMGPAYAKDLHKNVGKWISEGSFKSQSDITDGIDHAAEAFLGMLSGKNFGKAILKIASE
ncbi:hypothetical protein MMC25_004711 [Agyrium rufum]|nr:hypothetical protein [Agyrium rufum]